MSEKGMKVTSKLLDRNYLKRVSSEYWSKGKYKDQERVLNNYFEEHKDNTDLDVILIKATLVNSFYSTQIYDIYQVAKHICDMKIDKSLQAGNMDAITNIQEVHFVKDDNTEKK